jgi:hypothetical protein
LSLVFAEAKRAHPDCYADVAISVPYPHNPRQRCDVKLNIAHGRVTPAGSATSPNTPFFWTTPTKMRFPMALFFCCHTPLVQGFAATLKGAKLP